MRKQLTIRQEKLLAHISEWQACTRCPLGAEAFKHVLYEQTPKDADRVDVLFIGEGPGESENLTGIPFFGRSGNLLRKMITEASTEVNFENVVFGISNVVACRPTDTRGRNRPPSSEEVKACLPRLVDLIQIFKPKCIVAIGNVARSNASDAIKKSGYKGRFRSVAHPAYILRRSNRSDEALIEYRQVFVELMRYVRTLR